MRQRVPLDRCFACVAEAEPRTIGRRTWTFVTPELSRDGGGRFDAGAVPQMEGCRKSIAPDPRVRRKSVSNCLSLFGATNRTTGNACAARTFCRIKPNVGEILVTRKQDGNRCEGASQRLSRWFRVRHRGRIASWARIASENVFVLLDPNRSLIPCPKLF